MKRLNHCIRRTCLVLFLAVFLRTEAEGMVTLTPALHFSERYSDNLFFSESDRESDYTTLVGPDLTLSSASRDVSFLGRYSGSFEANARHPHANRYTQGLFLLLNSSSFGGPLKGLQAELSQNILHTPEIPAFVYGDRNSEEGARVGNEGIQVTRNNSFQSSTSISLRYPWTRLFDTRLSYTNTVSRYEAPNLEDSLSHNVSLTAGFQQSRQRRWVISYGYGTVLFDNSERLQDHRVTIGADYRSDRLTVASGNIGVAFVPEESPRLVLNAKVANRLKAGSYSFSYNSGIGRGGGVTTDPVFNQGLTAQVTMTLARNLSGEVQVGYGRNTTLSGGGLKIQTLEAQVGLSTSLLRWLRGGLSYNYLTQRDLATDTRDGYRNMVMLTLSATGLPITLSE